MILNRIGYLSICGIVNVSLKFIGVSQNVKGTCSPFFITILIERNMRPVLNHTGESLYLQRDTSDTERVENISTFLYDIESHGITEDYELSFYYDVDGAFVQIEKLSFIGEAPDLNNDHVKEQIKDQLYEHINTIEYNYMSSWNFTLILDHKWSGDL